MGTTLTVWLAFLSTRMLSGARNGLYYGQTLDNAADGRRNRIAAVALMTVISGALVLALSTLHAPCSLPFVCGIVPQFVFNLYWPLWAVSLAASVLTLFYSYPAAPKLVRDIHLWTLAEQTFLAAALVAVSPTLDCLAALACCVYPAVLAQKALINHFSGKPLDYDGTDDPAGRWYSIPVLGVKVPRTTQHLRMWLSLASIFVLITYTIYTTIV